MEQLLSSGDYLDMSGKLKTLNALLKKWKQDGRKVLVFSSSTKMLDIIQEVISPLYGFSRIDGSTPVKSRQTIVDQYNNADIENNFVFLISTKAGGLGLNITCKFLLLY